MKLKILFLTLALLATIQAADPKAAGVLNDALKNFKTMTYAEALQAANAIKTEAAQFPGNSYFGGLHGQIATVFTAERKLESAKAELAQKKADLTRQPKTIGQSRQMQFDAKRKIDTAKQELSAMLESANGFSTSSSLRTATKGQPRPSRRSLPE